MTNLPNHPTPRPGARHRWPTPSGRATNGRADSSWPNGSLGPTKTFTHKRYAEEWATEQELAIRKGTYYDPDKAKTTFGEYADTSRAARFYAGQSEAVMDSYYKNHITPILGHVPFRHFTRELVQRWLKGLTNTRNGEPRPLRRPPPCSCSCPGW